MDPGWYSGVLGHALRYAGKYDEALKVLSEYNRQKAGFGLVDMVLTYNDMNDTEKAKMYAKLLLTSRPDFMIET